MMFYRLTQLLILGASPLALCLLFISPHLQLRRRLSRLLLQTYMRFQLGFLTHDADDKNANLLGYFMM